MKRSSAGTTDFGWLRTADRRPPRLRLADVVQELVRARRDQLLLARVWDGLFWGTLAAAGWVLLARLVLLVQNPWPGVGCALVLALSWAVATAWLRRPDDLQVAIRADLDLGLEQTLSTAWELERRGADEALSERLARQAVTSYRLPRRGREVFRPAATPRARLIPLAVLGVLLAAAVPLPSALTPEPPPLDAVVVEEGRRLREFGLQMQRRAQRDDLQRSAAGSQTLQELGNRMHGGMLSRAEALARLHDAGAALREQARSAAGAGGYTPPGADAWDHLGGSPLPVDARLRELLEKLLAGAEAGDGVETLEAAAAELSALGVADEFLREALRRLAEGDERELRAIVERLQRLARALREMQELQQADQRLRLARENLGERADDGEQSVVRIDDGPRGGAGRDVLVLDPNAPRGGDDPAGRIAVAVAARGSGGGGDDMRESRRQRGEQPDARGALLKPAARPGEGAEHRTHARVLPREGSPVLETLTIDRRFAAQVEEVLSKEEIPLHERELVRRYFLTLGAEAETTP